MDFNRNLTRGRTSEWMEALYSICLGEASLDELLALADDASSPRKLRGEVYFHAAAKALAMGNRRAAFAGFERAMRSYDGELGYTYHAKTLWRKMRDTPNWPRWIPLLVEDSGETHAETEDQ